MSRSDHDAPPTTLITGASRGIGLALTQALSARGWKVIAACRDPDAAQDLRALAAASDGAIRPAVLDVTDPISIAALVRRLDGAPLDVLVNNAGIAHRDTPFGALDYGAWMRVLEVNLLAPVRVTEALIGNLEAGRRRAVVAMASSLGSIARTTGGNYFYRTSKAALNMAMRSLAEDLKARGVTVAMLSPGYVDTDFTRGMGGPKVSVEESAEGLAKAIENLGPADSGRFFRYTGEDIEW